MKAHERAGRRAAVSALLLGLLATGGLVALRPLQAATSTSSASSAGPLVLVLDASGSMWGQIEGENKIVIARRALRAIEIVEGETVERQVDFSSGELLIGVTRNGALADATVRVYRAGTQHQVAAGRTYTRPTSNPERFRLTPGAYDVVIASVEIAGAGDVRLPALAVEAGGRVERTHAFTSGRLRVGAVNGSDLVDATVRVVSADSGRPLDQGRTYTNPKSNPRAFELPPGQYRVIVKAVRLPGKPSRELAATVAAGGDTTLTVDYSR